MRYNIYAENMNREILQEHGESPAIGRIGKSGSCFCKGGVIMNIYDFVIRISLALVLGFCIGLERQLTGHLAGIRINILICLGSSFFTLFPMLFDSDQVFRVGAAIISGVGFLCSGVIFKNGGSVKGINTAATLWCTAAIGILSSTGRYLIAVIATAVLILSNIISRPLAQKIHPLINNDETEKQYRISVTCMESAEHAIRKLLIGCNSCKTLYLVRLESGDVCGDKIEIFAEYNSVGKAKNHVLESIVGKVLENPAVVRASWGILE